MSFSQTGAEATAICTDCGYQQSVIISASGLVRPCQHCASDLRFEREIICPHCRKGVFWNADLAQCPLCGGGFAPGIPLRPKPARSLTRVLTVALDVAKAKELEYLEADSRRRSDGLYRAWAALSRKETAMVEESAPTREVRPVARTQMKASPWYRRGTVLVGLAAALAVIAWGGVTVWRLATKQAVLERLSELSTANRKADGQAVGSFYGSTLVRFQSRYDVPHEQAVRTVGQLFRDYPFVIRFEYKNPLFESVSIWEVSLLVDQEWELRGNEVYSGSERHRLIWTREAGEWRIASQELIKRHWSRKSAPGADAGGGATAIGVRQ